MLPFWSRFKHGVLQNLTATYFRGLFVVSAGHSVAYRSLAFQRCWWPTVSRNKLVTGGVCLLMVPGNGDYFSTRLSNINNTQICNYCFWNYFIAFYLAQTRLIVCEFNFVAKFCIILSFFVYLLFSCVLLCSFFLYVEQQQLFVVFSSSPCCILFTVLFVSVPVIANQNICSYYWDVDGAKNLVKNFKNCSFENSFWYCISKCLCCFSIPAQKLRQVGFRGMHSSIEDLKMAAMQIKILPALQDNYMYMVSKLYIIH